MKIAFLQDFFHNEIVGGAEQNDSVLLNYLNNQEEFTVVPVHTYLADSVVECYDFFVVSNFVRLSEDVKKYLMYNKNYIIYEHDHKYVNTRNPAAFPRFEIPQQNIINYEFYKNAKKIFVLSNICKEVMEKTLNISNIQNIGCSLWSSEKLSILRNTLASSEKIHKFSILDSSNAVKGTAQAKAFCKQNSIEPKFIGDSDYQLFMEQLAESEHLVFFPQVLETYSRLIAEAKMLNCKVVTTPKMSGFFSEEYSNLTGIELIDKIEHQIHKALPEFKKSILE